jgi:hypothetical protein
MKSAIGVAVFVLLNISVAQAADVTFTSNDVIAEGDAYDNVYVYSPPPGQTTVDMTGGTIGGFLLHDTSTVNMFGGQGMGAEIHDAATLNLYDGSLLESAFVMDSGTIDFRGGAVREYGVEAYGSSSVRVSSGGMLRLFAYESSRVDISGGYIVNSMLVRNSAIVNMSGGEIGDMLYAEDSPEINMRDGKIWEVLLSGESSAVMNMSGGQMGRLLVSGTTRTDISSGVVDMLYAEAASTVNMYGSDFEYDPDAGAWQGGQLTGLWGDGASFSVDLHDDAEAGNHTYSHIVLHEIPSLLGDTDHDGDVDLADLGALAGHYGTVDGATWAMGDLDGDGDVDLTDLGLLAGNYGRGTDEPTSANFAADRAIAFSTVPEPNTMFLLGLGMFGLLRRKRGG